MSKKKELSYQESLDKVTDIIRIIEEEQPDIDQLGDMVSEAVALIKNCKSKLKQTEDKIAQALSED
ncbi:exodeoxyribonuclease VII small subunit [Penaeicola halotolerans]|uniref:exodeoxyribonuclease VII small subunit n=1 Tax=Penaeicola halotolerans TaxID=2793196 RepID=UPI001CF9224C|nr:exodeoxyribonuclease VII small subunit [Penaeicola halotolerans]